MTKPERVPKPNLSSVHASLESSCHAVNSSPRLIVSRLNLEFS